MSLSDRQRDDLHRSILSYLQSQKLHSSHKVLTKELALGDGGEAIDEKRYAGLLERKWMSVIRLQKKVMDLEQAMSDLQSSVPTHFAQVNGKVDLSTWVPRAPARYSLSGHKQPITGLSFHPVFNTLATSSEDTSIKIWDWESGDFERTLKGHTKGVTDVDFGPAGTGGDRTTADNGAPVRSTLLASCSSDLTIKLWNADDEYRCIKTLYGHNHVISAVKFIPGLGDQLASISRDCTIRIWEVSTGLCTKTIDNAHGDWIRCLAPSFDGTYVLTAGSDRIAKLFNITTGQSKIHLTGHEHVIECVAIAPVSSHKHFAAIAGTKPSKTSFFAATGSRDKSIRLWNLENGLCIATLDGHDNWVRALLFHPDGRYLLSSGDDKAIKIWDLEQGCRCCRTIDDAHGHFISCLKWGLSTSQLTAQGHPSTNDKQVTTNGGTPATSDVKGRYVIASAGVDQVVKVWLP